MSNSELQLIKEQYTQSIINTSEGKLILSEGIITRQKLLLYHFTIMISLMVIIIMISIIMILQGTLNVKNK